MVICRISPSHSSTSISLVSFIASSFLAGAQIHGQITNDCWTIGPTQDVLCMLDQLFLNNGSRTFMEVIALKDRMGQFTLNLLETSLWRHYTELNLTPREKYRYIRQLKQAP